MQNQYKKLFNFQFVSIKFTAIANQYYFPDIPMLRDRKVYKINTYFASTLPKDNNNTSVVGINTNTAPPYTNTDSNYYLTLYINGAEKIKSLDMNLINTIQAPKNTFSNSGSLFLQPTTIDFSKSYVQQSFGTTAMVPPLSFAFGIYYL
jgi:hypothetical protein